MYILNSLLPKKRTTKPLPGPFPYSQPLFSLSLTPRALVLPAPTGRWYQLVAGSIRAPRSWQQRPLHCQPSAIDWNPAGSNSKVRRFPPAASLQQECSTESCLECDFGLARTTELQRHSPAGRALLLSPPGAHQRGRKVKTTRGLETGRKMMAEHHQSLSFSLGCCPL